MDRLRVAFTRDVKGEPMRVSSPVLDKQSIMLGAQPAIAGAKPSLVMQVFFLVAVPHDDSTLGFEWVDSVNCVPETLDMVMVGEGLCVVREKFDPRGATKMLGD